MSPGPDRGPDCARCNDDGLVLIADEKDTAYGACPDCDRGNRLYLVLRAIARGEPIAQFDGGVQRAVRPPTMQPLITEPLLTGSVILVRPEES